MANSRRPRRRRNTGGSDSKTRGAEPELAITRGCRLSDILPQQSNVARVPLPLNDLMSNAIATPPMTPAVETMASRPPAIALHNDVEDDPMDVEDSPMRDGRNENSLAYLCQRFCEMYRNHSDPINIDLAAKELGIQRRRMYEILNIIQSVGLVSRLRASFYRWDGQDKMATVLEKLKDDGMARIANSRPNASESINPAACMSPEGQRRKAVATALGERFVQIFLCNEVSQPVILEDIMGLFMSCVGASASPAALTNQTSCARRLYDIANVFCSIGLVRKSCSAATDNRRKKRLYVWIGPVPPSTTTPLRPQRATLVAPSASPGSASGKRIIKRENSMCDTPPTASSSSARKKSRLGNASLDLEASIRQAEQEDDKTKHKVLQHPAVTALRMARSTLMPPAPPSAGPLGGAAATGGPRGGEGSTKRAMLVARSLDSPSSKASASSLSSSSSSSSSSSLFHPLNSKDGPPLLSSAFRSAAPLASTTTSSTKTTATTAKPSSSSSSSTSSSSPSSSSLCPCKSESHEHHHAPPPPPLPATESPALLKAQIDQLKKELQDAKTREQELLKRIDMQDSQINKLIDVKVSSSSSSSRSLALSPPSSSSSSSAFLLNAGSSPLTSLVFSPFQGSLARDAFSAFTASSPSPFSGNNFFSTGLTGSGSAATCSNSSGRPPFLRKARIGPHLIDPTDDLLLSPGTTSIASALLLSPVATGGGATSTPTILEDKEEEQNNHHHRFVDVLGSPMRLLPPTIKSEPSSGYYHSQQQQKQAPSTPPCHLLATAASSLLSLTPQPQVPHSMSPSPGRLFARNQTTSDSEQDEENDEEAMGRRHAASSPEPSKASLSAAPSSPSPSAKGAKTIIRHHTHSHSSHHNSPFSGRSPLPKPKARIPNCLT